MKPILIRKDDHLIKQHHQNFKHMMQDGQEIIDLFKSLGIELTPQDIHNFLHVHKSQTVGNLVQEFVASKILEKVGKPEFNGIPIKKEKLRDMIEMPDVSHIKQRLEDLKGKYSHNDGQLKSFRHNQVQIVNGTIKAVDNVHEEIEKQHTHYSQTNRGHEVATKLLKISKDITDLCDFLGKSAKGNYLVRPERFIIPGLINVFEDLPQNKQYSENTGEHDVLIQRKHIGHRLDLNFIRNQESLFSDK